MVKLQPFDLHQSATIVPHAHMKRERREVSFV